MKRPTTKIIPTAAIYQRIHLVRGMQVMLDADRAKLYGVTTSNLNLAVRRNIDRFPSDFMFQLKKPDLEGLRMQFAISKRGGCRGAISDCFLGQFGKC